MADRYWVGGTGSWSSTNTANWAASSGGASGATVPTASDNVFFDANSNVGTGAFTVTMANTPRVCNDFTASGLDGTMTLAGSSIGLTVSGSLEFPVASFTRSYTGTTTFNATTTGKTVTVNGKIFGGAVTFDGVGGGWTLGSAFSCGTSTLTVTNGTFSTSGSNYAITCGTFSSNNSNIRTINLNASTVTLSNAWTFTTSTNLTFTAGTSQINLTATTATFSGGGLTYRNVATTSSALVSSTISGANTFNNLTIGGRSSAGISQLTISSDDQTINGTFTVGAGTTEVTRTKIICTPFGTTRTLTCAAVSFTHVDFQDITIAGAASPASGTGLGNAGNNSGITFPAAKTVYYRQTGSNSWGVTGTGSWSLTSGGAADATAFPLAQDTAVFPAATYPASGSTTTINAAYFISTIDMSLRTSNTMTLASSTTNFPVIGNWINGTGITLSGTGIINFEGSGSQTITNAGRTFTQSIQIRSPSGSVTLQDPLTLGSTRTFTLTNGTLDLQSYTLSTGLFSSTNSNTRTIAFGTGNIECTGTGTVWNTSTVTGLTTTGTQVVNVTSVGSTAITVTPGALSEANSISYNFTGGTYALTFLGTANHTARNVDFTGYAGTLGAISSANVIYGNLKLSAGMTLTASSSIVSFGGTSGTQQITTNTKTLNFPIYFDGTGGAYQLQDNFTMGSTRTATLVKGTLDLQSFTLSTGLFDSSNSNTRTIAFGTGQINCTGTGTVYTTGLPTNLTCTGSKTVNITSVGSTAISVDSNAPSGSSSYQNINFTGGTYALTLSTFAVNNVNFTGFNGSYTPTSNIAILGNLTLSAGMTYGAATTTMQFVGDGTTQQITSNGKTINENVNLQSTGGTLQLQDALTISSTKTFTLTYGTLDIQSYTLSTGLFSSDNSYARTIAFGTGQMSVSGSGTVWATSTITNLSVSGSKTVNFTSVGSATLTVNNGALSEADALDFNVTGGTYDFQFGYNSGDNSVKNLNFTGFSGSWNGLLGTAIIYGNLIMSSTMTTGSSGTKKFSATSGTKTITSNGASLNIVDFNGVGGTWQLQDNMNVTQPSGVDFRNGTVDLNGQTLTTLRGKTSAGTKNITFNGGTLAITDTSIIAWNNAGPTNFTTTAGTGTGKISMTSASAKDFNGGGSTYNCVLEQAGVGTLDIGGSNTFLDITNTVQPTIITFQSGTTQTFINGFSLSGTAGNLVTINQSSATQAILSKASGTVSVSFCSISYSNATGGATWEALTLNGNVNGGNNNGWLFGAGGAGNMFLMF